MREGGRGEGGREGRERREERRGGEGEGGRKRREAAEIQMNQQECPNPAHKTLNLLLLSISQQLFCDLSFLLHLLVYLHREMPTAHSTQHIASQLQRSAYLLLVFL